MLIIEARAARQERHDEELKLPFELRQKSRLRTKLESGEEVGLFLERGTILRDNDFLLADEGRIVQVRAAPEHTLRVSCATQQNLIRVAYHLGNRHVPVQIGDGWLRLQCDAVLKEMLLQLGASVTEELAPFDPEGGAYGSGHGSASVGREESVAFAAVHRA